MKKVKTYDGISEFLIKFFLSEEVRIYAYTKPISREDYRDIYAIMNISNLGLSSALTSFRSDMLRIDMDDEYDFIYDEVDFV